VKTLRSALASFARSPLKFTLTLLTVGLGVGVLIFALSISSAFSRFLREQLDRNGMVVMVANATISEETGQMEPVRPSQLDEEAPKLLAAEVPGVTAVTLVDARGFTAHAAGDGTWRIRTVVEASEGYAQVMGLQMTAGSFFTAADVAAGAKKAAISESLAQIVFGSAQAAIGKTMRPPSPTGTADARSPVMPTFTVSGVFADVGELERTSYGVADMVIPYTAALPQGANAQMARRFASSTMALKVQGVGLGTVEAQVRAALARTYGEEVAIQVWEGTPRGETATIQEARTTVRTFSLLVNLLGFILLLTGSIGILSIMLVEVLGRSRQIAIERALGASGSIILREYFVRSLVLAGLAAAAGVVLGLAFAEPLRRLVLPIFNGVHAADLGSRVITPGAVGVGILSALVVGGVFGMFPVLPALRANIAESMRDV